MSRFTGLNPVGTTKRDSKLSLFFYIYDMKHILNYFNYLIENLNNKYVGSFINHYKNWYITYSDRPGHYITDRLINRSETKIHDPVIVINGLVKKMIDYIEDSNITNIDKYCVKFKKRGFHVIFEFDGKRKVINLNTILRLDMTYDCKKIDIK